MAVVAGSISMPMPCSCRNHGPAVGATAVPVGRGRFGEHPLPSCTDCIGLSLVPLSDRGLKKKGSGSG